MIHFVGVSIEECPEYRIFKKCDILGSAIGLREGSIVDVKDKDGTNPFRIIDVLGSYTAAKTKLKQYTNTTNPSCSKPSAKLSVQLGKKLLSSGILELRKSNEETLASQSDKRPRLCTGSSTDSSITGNTANVRIEELMKENEVLKRDLAALIQKNKSLENEVEVLKRTDCTDLKADILEIKEILKKSPGRVTGKENYIELGRNGTKVRESIVNLIPRSTKDYSKAVRVLLHGVFGYKYLATHSLTGTKRGISGRNSSTIEMVGVILEKSPLNVERVNDITEYLLNLDPFKGNVSRSQIRHAITSKCNDCSTYFKKVNGNSQKIQQHLQSLGVEHSDGLYSSEDDEDLFE